MRRFFENKRLIVLLLSVITSLSLIAFSVLGERSVPKPLNWVNDFMAMIGRVVATPTNALMNFGDAIVDVTNTYEENQRLKKQIGTLQELKVQNEQLRAENESLTHLIGLEPSLIGKTVVSASVISRVPNEWEESLTIDVGSVNGIKKDMSVMTDAGLIGRVYEVGPTSSKVRLLTAEAKERLAVAAGIHTKDQIEFGVIEAYDRRSNELVLEQVAPDAEIEPGDTVTTNGLGGVSPEGLIVGTVARTSVDDFGLSQQVRVKPSANFNDIRHVFVVINMGAEPHENHNQGVTVEAGTFTGDTDEEDAGESNDDGEENSADDVENNNAEAAEASAN